MDVAIAGGHGKIALLVSRLLVERADSVRGLIRNPEHAADLDQLGAEPVICDMEAEADLRSFVEGADAVVFAVGAGPDSAPERKRSVDLGAAVKLMDAGVRRYVMVSAIGAGDPVGAAESMGPIWRPRPRPTRRFRAAGSTSRSCVPDASRTPRRRVTWRPAPMSSAATSREPTSHWPS